VPTEPFPGFFLCYPQQRNMAPAVRALIDAIRPDAKFVKETAQLQCDNLGHVTADPNAMPHRAIGYGLWWRGPRHGR